MESYGNNDTNFSDVVDNLKNMFGKFLSKDVISAVVESCDGDLNLSMDAIMNMTNDGNVITEEESEETATKQNVPSTQPSSTNQPIQLSSPSRPCEILTTNQVAQPSSTNQPIQHSPPSPPSQILTTSQLAPLALTSQPYQQSITKNPITSYASSAAQTPPYNTGAIPKTTQKVPQPIVGIWTDQIKEIITNHNQGNRILIIMRGVPGSGKSYLARQLVDTMVGASPDCHKNHILSTDDYFMVRGQYQYERYKLQEAHSWNQTRARNACIMGRSPVIIDNTNIELWEMEPYVREGVKNGYIIQVVEPKTPWAKKANQLVRKNLHNVPLANIKRMLDNYRDGITGDSLKHTYGLAYPADMVPPVKRITPPIVYEQPPTKPDTIVKEDTATSTTSKTVANSQFIRPSASAVNDQTQQVLTIANPEQQNDHSNLDPQVDKEKDTDFFVINPNDDLNNESQVKPKLTVEDRKKLEEMEEIEKEWETGGNWDSEDQGSVKTSTTKNPGSDPIITSSSDAKTPRKYKASPPVSPSLKSAESLMKNVNECEDWSQISMYMPSWDDSSETLALVANQEVPIETTSTGTCWEIGDTNLNGKYKVITATPRNINEFHIPFNREKIPQKWMLDKSSMTNELDITEASRCPNIEKHFISFRKLFKNIARSDLRDIFDKCNSDVNWSVDIVLDGMNNNQFQTIETEELIDSEEESIEQCACLAKYDVIPDVATRTAGKTTLIEEKVSVAATFSPSHKKKRDLTMSEGTFQMKRQIEQNVVIADNHYSKHCLKLRKIRRGEPDLSENSEELGSTELSAEAAPFVSKRISNNKAGSDDENSSEDSSLSGCEEDAMVTIDLGHSFIAQLDEKFGRQNMQYPEYIVPRISIPMSRLNEINAIWMESLTCQLDEHARKSKEMMEQDEEFARQLAMKETGLSQTGKESEVPDFKEIMDRDMAFSIYQKDVAAWRNNLPTDLAAKMTRDKLFNLFPDVDKDILTELLMAHNNDFKATVEVLLSSTGRKHVLDQENGVEKFVSTEEMKLKEKTTEEQKKELHEAEWPLLSRGREVDLATVNSYRADADNHLARSNLNRQKAQEYFRRGEPKVAAYYSGLADYHKKSYEYANGMAVASLMQYHAANNPDATTIDLHYLRVKEAKESLDLFIDAHVTKLRETGNTRNQTLFFITGRGIHSHGRARIKPAAMDRLKQRGLWFYVKNPGLLAAKVNHNTKLSSQISVP